jgi:hypothetical protein
MTDIPDDAPDRPAPDDASLLDELRDAFEVDVDLPPGLVEAARAAFDWRRIDDELAELSAGMQVAGTRAGGGSEAIVFRSAGRRVDVELHPQPGGLVLTGQFEPVASVRVRWESPRRASEAAPVDELGMFQLAGAPPGPLRLVFDLDDGTRLLTDWITG